MNRLPGLAPSLADLVRNGEERRYNTEPLKRAVGTGLMRRLPDQALRGLAQAQGAPKRRGPTLAELLAEAEKASVRALQNSTEIAASQKEHRETMRERHPWYE